jgi:uncharacterized repeat protein (TIGR02543 family)
MKKQHRGDTATKHLKQWSLALAAGASLFTGAARADTTITGSPATITGNVLTTFWDGAGTVTFAAGASLTQAGDQVAPPTGYVITNPLIFEGNASLRFNGNDTKYNFSGPISGTAAGNLIIKTEQAVSGNGDRPDIAFSSPVPDGSGGTIGFNLYFNTQSDSQSYVNFTAVNTFTGPITLNTPNNNSIGYLTIGGERYKKAFDATNYTIPGSGSIGPAANYPGNITTATRTVLGFNTSANQEISGVISGAGSVRKEIAGSTLTLSGLNTYTGTTTVDAGTVALTSTGGLTFLVNDASSNKITGAGTATLDGQFTIDTSAVTVSFNSWKLVDTTTSSYGSNFSVAAPYTENVPGIWTYVNGAQIFQFVEATSTLYVSDYASIIYFGIPGSTAVIDQNALTITLTVPYNPWGTSGLTTLAPSFGASTGTVTANTNAVTSGGVPTPTFAATNPATYKVSDLDNMVEKEYTVQVNVTPASTQKVLSDLYFPGYGYAWAADNTGVDPYSLLMVIPAADSVTSLAPSFSISTFASVDVASNTARDFTTPKTYTVTAQDGSSQVYTVTVQKITGTGVGTYQQKILASGPVSYWPLNETTGSTATDLSRGINPITYSGTYLLNQAGLRPDANPSIQSVTSGTTGTPGNPTPTSLKARNFTVEAWVQPNNTNVQYLVSTQDRTTGNRLGYALWRNNTSSFGIMAGDGSQFGVSINGTTVIAAGKKYHVVGTYDGATLKLYVNGNLENSMPLTNHVSAASAHPGFTIGSRNGVTGDNSNIQDVAVYTRALSQAEIQDHAGLIITYSGNGSNGGTVPSYGIGYNSGDTFTVASDTMTRSNYTFVNWNTQANGSGSSYNPAATFSITANTTLYAQWKLTDYVAWEAIYAPNNLSNPASNFDGDSLSNFQEYAFGLDPTSGASVNPISVPFDSAIKTFSYTKRATAPLTYTIWYSTNLQTWTQDSGATQLSAGVIGDVETMDATLSGAAVPVGGKLFVQVRAQ